MLDTNVVSEVVRAQPATAVLTWFEQVEQPLALTAVTVAELLSGVRMLPLGARRDGLMRAIEEVLLKWAIQLPYDSAAARIHAELREFARSVGRGLSVEDGMIVAICAVHGATLATRNVKDFEFLQVPLLNPWDVAF